VWIVPLVAAVVAAAPALAQINNGIIEVIAVDSDGAGLPGVTVQAVNPETGLKRISVTDGNGMAVLPSVPTGTYTVSANLDGFATVEQEGIGLRVGQTVRLRMTMRVEISETITVTAEAPLVDVLRTDTSTNIVPEQIQELPVPDREFEKLAFIAPGVQRERGAFRFIQGGPVIGAGGNASQSSILVDGVEFTDQALGLSRARFSQDAIQEFRVVTGRFDSEIGGSQGGALSVVTKSGTNEVRGSVFAFYRNDALRAKGELDLQKNDYTRYQLGATVGGPIAVDRAHYFVSLEYVDTQDVTLFRPGGAFADQAQDFDRPFKQTLGLASFNLQPSDAHSLVAKLAYEQYREENFRVGGVADISNGQELNRDNWNLTLGHSWVIGDGNRLNELRFQIGQRDYDEPTNSKDVEEWFSGGNTLRIGNNVVGDLIGEGRYWELRDTFHLYLSGGHDLKLGGAWFSVEERSVIDTFQEGLFIYATDDRTIPITYIYGIGSSDVTVDTDIFSVFVQDDWRVRDNVTVSLGLRYDLDRNGNNPDFQHSLTGPRSRDEDNFQPRFGFSWDVANDGANVVRGGAGIFTGRYLLVPVFTELQQNGESGRVTRSNLNGLILGLPPEFWLDPADPENTGIALPPDISLLQDSLEAPESTQYSLGYTRRLGNTGLFADVEVLYVEGDNEITIRDTNFGGNANPVRPNPLYNQINKYENLGRSEYLAYILGVNGTIKGGHLIACNITWSDKKNISDDFSPAFPTGYPSDPFDMEGEWGYSRGHEDYRIVLSGVFRLPWQMALAPIWQYGSGQPWNHILGYDFNGDGKNSDRPEGVARNSMEGPKFSSFSLRWTKTFTMGGGELDLIVEGFNLFNEVNYDVSSVDNAQYLSGPTLANPDLPYVENPNFGNYRATLSPLEVQLGVRYQF
jgi:hypothetical protein